MASGLALTTLTAADPPGAAMADRAWAQVVDEFEASDAALSRFQDTSGLTALNRASLQGSSLAVGRRLRAAVAACDRAHRLTGGRFDPRVIAHLDAWGYRGASLGPGLAPTALGGEGRIVRRVDRRRIRLDRPIDLGGIGKGLAVRWAADRVRRAGVDRFLLDAGGDIAAHGRGPDDGPWRIGIEDPTGGEPPLAVVTVEDGAIATSSLRRGRWSAEGRERHHLIDPETGEPADGDLWAVTVAGPDPAWAEVWSKALFIAGRQAIAAEARARGLAAWWVGGDGTLEMTPAARLRTTWVAAEA